LSEKKNKNGNVADITDAQPEKLTEAAEVA
jgi:hypothetical protein